MDPKANVSDQMQLAARLLWQAENDKPISSDDVAKLAELAIALDEWRRRGGFDPYASSAPSSSPPAHPAVSLLVQLRQEWPLDTVGTDDDINGGDVVEWLGELVEQIDSALSAPANVYRIPVKHTLDDGHETHPEAIIEVQADDAHGAYMQVEGLLVAGGDADDWEIGEPERAS